MPTILFQVRITLRLSVIAGLPVQFNTSSASAEVLKIGSRRVEGVSGMWFNPAGSNTEEWQNDQDIHTFRWEEDGVYFTVQFWVNETFSPAFLTEER